MVFFRWECPSGGETGEKVGTFALAYAAHRAASLIRFPPTVALTPVVCYMILVFFELGVPEVQL